MAVAERMIDDFARATHNSGEASDGDERHAQEGATRPIDPALCPVEVAARIIGQKWTLQIVKTLLNCESQRFCELQEALGGVNPSTLSSRLKMLEDEGMIRRVQISAIPPHVEYSLTEMGCELQGVIQAISGWSRHWLCTAERLHSWDESE
jgi:DNA-binding HxlR family transcriptional regulator